MTEETLKCVNCKHRILLDDDQYIHRARAYQSDRAYQSGILTRGNKCGIAFCECRKPKLGATVVYNE